MAGNGRVEVVDLTGSAEASQNLLERLHSVSLKSNDTAHSEGLPPKRRKICQEAPVRKPNWPETLIAQTYMLLGNQHVTDLEGLSKIAPQCYQERSEEDRRRAIRLLGWLPCSLSATTFTVIEQDHGGAILSAECAVCDATETVLEPSKLLEPGDQVACQLAREVLESLHQVEEFQESQTARVYAMGTLRRLLLHMSSFWPYQFAEPLGVWCLQSLQSSKTALRIAAGRTLPAFMAQDDATIMEANWHDFVQYAKDISPKVPLHHEQTWAMAWGQLARTLNDDKLSLCLCRLVDYLGHRKQIVAQAAFTEILFAAEARKMKVEEMFTPFWRHIAHPAVKDLHNKPQTAQAMADLLGINLNVFLVKTQAHTLPWLVLSQDHIIITRISQARGDETVAKAILENVAPIMAVLLRQQVPDHEKYIMDLLGKISPKFHGHDLVDVLKMDAIGIALELLRAAGEADDSQRSQVRNSLRVLAEHCVQVVDRKKRSKVATFLKQYCLGLVAYFSDVLNDARSSQTHLDKIRSLRGLEEMLKIGRIHVAGAIPQMCTCLLAVSSDPSVRSVAFEVWSTMIRSFGAEEIAGLVEVTFAMILQHWNTYSDETKVQGRQLIEHILDSRLQTLGISVDSLPSLVSIPELEAAELRLGKMRSKPDPKQRFTTFCKRLCHEQAMVVDQTLIELADYLDENQSYLQVSAASEQPDKLVGELLRNVLDACVRFGHNNKDVANHAAKCIGLIGCLDPNRVEAVRENREFIMTSNFYDNEETTDFVLFLLEHSLVPGFASAIDLKVQGLYGYAIQELLKICDFRVVVPEWLKGNDRENMAKALLFKKWEALPEYVRSTVEPLLTSSYHVNPINYTPPEYPLFPRAKDYNTWIKTLVQDLLARPHNPFTTLIFPALSRVARTKDGSVANFLFPYVAMHVATLGSREEKANLRAELLCILEHNNPNASQSEINYLKLCSEAIFRVMDYLARWLHKSRNEVNVTKNPAMKDIYERAIRKVDDLIASIPAEAISKRAVLCGSHARALFHYEAHIREVQSKKTFTECNEQGVDKEMLVQLQNIYAQIDEPDGIDGISAHLHVLDIDQQILGHQKAGRWTAVQSWFEIKLEDDPLDVDSEVNLMDCLKQSGQYDMLIKEAESYGFSRNHAAVAKLLPFATEAAWATGRWDALENYVAMAPKDLDVDFNVNVGRLLLLLKNNPKDTAAFEEGIDALREHIASSLTEDSTSSLTKCRDQVLRFHALTELETIGCTARYTGEGAKSSVVDTLNRRLEVVGAYLKDKQYLLGLRRAAMSLSRNFFKDRDIASLWMSTARLAREENSLHFAYNAVLHATKLGDDSATIEHARLLWKEGNQRKAINSLEGAIIADAFMPPPGTQKVSDATSRGTAGAGTKNQPLKARAYLLLAKWLDEAGQTQTAALRKKYQEATAADLHWEKGHYYLGRHYNKLLETEKAEKPEQQSQAYLTGETSKLVIENYLRALKCGTKYVYQTLPRIITLWLDLGMLVRETPEQKVGDRSFYATLKMTREDQLKNLHHKIEAYLPKIPAYIWYTALSQMLSRIAHPNQDVFKHLQKIIVKVIVAHPQHALWNLLAVTVSNQLDRKTRGGTILLAVKNTAAKSSLDIGSMIQRGQKLSKELLNACVTGTFESNKTCWVGLVKDLGFRPREACPNQLAVPIQSVLTATLPTLTGTVRGHKAFSRDVITIHSFEEQVMVLSSLAKPRKVTVRGSDGRKYGLLLKPKDDLRKDQRLMEFNGMINRSLKRDAESSKRQLYIRTYAVTPLNEECGIIEWVDGLRTHRDIIFEYYKQHNVIVNYAETKNFCDQAMRDPELLEKFGEEVLAKYPPMFHLWFVKQFPEPSVWFNARLRYTRSCAVMSMIGTILGLGDRHTENILVEEGNGGIFHVDFNCLFDKGLTFQQPERVPFRLTQNMRDAMGVYQHEGPFRKTCELTLKLLRQHEETLMTILEAFVYDPTLDFIEDKRKRKRETKSAVPDTPYAVLVAIKRKIRGLLQEETIPLGVEGQVDELIRQATSWKNLASMYIGWCSFM